MEQSFRLLLKNIKQLVQVSDKKEKFKRMKDCTDVVIKSKQSVIVGHDGIIYKIGDSETIQKQYGTAKFETVVDCKNYCVIPGYVDAHTHAVFAGDRSKEYEMKLNGKGYVDIYNLGLGIRFTVNSIASSTVQQLVEHLDRYIPRMSKLGTTTVQIKSGYGLDAENQVKMLKAIQLARIKYQNEISIISTFCGAHAIPKGKTQQEQTDNVINSQIPAVKQAMDKKQIQPKFIDVFCQKNFFQRQSSIKIMHEGKKIGLIPSFHGDQLNNLESGQIGKEVGAKAISHLQYLSENSIKIMSENQIVGILLPTTQNIQKLPIPPIKLMREHNMITALGSDFCPNAFCFNMGLVSHYSCSNYRLTPTQTLASCTLNAAFALGVEDQVGSIEQGKKGDMIILDVEDWVYIVYSFGDSFIHKVVKNGKCL